MLLELPEEEHEQAAGGAIVRLSIPGRPGVRDGFVIAQIKSVEPSPPYSVSRQRGDSRMVAVQLVCKRGTSLRRAKVSCVSNQDATEPEIDAWEQAWAATHANYNIFLDCMRQKAREIDQARKFTFDEGTVARILEKKGTVEFNAQRESRMRFLVQAALSQMDISDIRNTEADELEAKYNSAVEGLQEMLGKSVEMQARWFSSRPDLFSIKEINRKNLEKQMKDDRHALEFTLTSEASGQTTLNPFERRACRPVCAWDTTLTVSNVEGVGVSSGSTPLPAPGTPLPAAVTVVVQAAAPATSSTEAALRVHRKVNLMAKFGPLLAKQRTVAASG